MTLKVELLEPINYSKVYVPSFANEQSYNVYKITKAFLRKGPSVTPAYKNIDFSYSTDNEDEIDGTEAGFIITGADLIYLKHSEKGRGREMNVEGEKIFPLVNGKKLNVTAYYKVLNDFNSPEFLDLLNKQSKIIFRDVFLKPTGIDDSTKKIFGDLYEEL